MPKKDRIILFFTLLQLILLYVFGYTPYPDSEGYRFLAHESLEVESIYPVAELINLYPFLWNIGAVDLVELSLWLTGSITPLLVVYALMKGATAWLFHAVSHRLFGERVAMIALILYVCYPANYGEATSALSELPFVFFVFLALYAALVRHWLFTAGIILAVANWIRPMGLVVLIPLMGWVCFSVVRSERLKTSLKALYGYLRQPLTILGGYLLMIFVFGSINMARTGLFLYQAKSGWMALADYSTDHSPASLQIRDDFSLNVAQKDSAWQSLFFDWLKDHPMEYIQDMPTKLANTYASDNVNMCAFIFDKAEKVYMYDEVSMGSLISAFPRFSRVQWLTVVNLLIYYILLLGAIASLFYFRRKSVLPVSIVALGTLLLLFVGHGEARFHIPFMPFIIMMAAMYTGQKIWKG